MNQGLPPGPTLLVAAISTLSCATLRAQDLTGIIEAYEYPQYAGTASHFSFTNVEDMGELLFDGNAYIFCSDVAARSIDRDVSSYPHTLTQANSPLSLGGLDQMDVWDRYSNFQNEALATSQVRWLVDNYFESWFLNPASDSDERRYAFQNVIWEIFGDGGTADGLDFTNGNVTRDKFGPGGSSDSPLLWGYMNQLIDAVENSGVSETYDPIYQFAAALDSRPAYQDYLLLAANPQLMIPEPATGSMVMLAGAGWAMRRRRR